MLDTDTAEVTGDAVNVRPTGAGSHYGRLGVFITGTLSAGKVNLEVSGTAKGNDFVVDTEYTSTGLQTFSKAAERIRFSTNDAFSGDVQVYIIPGP